MLTEHPTSHIDDTRVIQERNSSNTPTVAYTRGNDLSGSLEGAGGIGGLLGRSHGYSSGTWSTHNHYHADGNGNITFLVNSGQTAEAWYRYDPYGRTMAQSTSALTTENLYRFSSKEIHAQSGMYYYGFRFYDPHLQRWPNRDPIRERGGINLYRIVQNNPVRHLDPLGLKHGNPVPPCAPYPECLSTPPPPPPPSPPPPLPPLLCTQPPPQLDCEKLRGLCDRLVGLEGVVLGIVSPPWSLVVGGAVLWYGADYCDEVEKRCNAINEAMKQKPGYYNGPPLLELQVQ